MMNLVRLVLMSAVALTAFSVPAKADYVVWTDVNTGLKLSYPDTWKQVNNSSPIDAITLSAPSDDNTAQCRVRVEEDKRFMIYPNANRQDIRDIYFSRDFWQKYTGEYNSVNIIREQDNAGLGQGFASMVLVSYLTPPSTPDAGDSVDKGGLMAVTHYYDKTYLVECSSSLVEYPKMHTAFLDIFKSISFKKAHHELMTGEYRNFLKEWGTLDVPFQNAVSRSTY
jgi:hypothetical protein